MNALISKLDSWVRGDTANAGTLKNLDDAARELDDVLIRLSGIRKSYVLGPVESEILKGVNLEVRRGDLLAIMGNSGCGKSTLMNIMGLMDKASSGNCVIAGQEVSDMTDDQQSDFRNLRIGFVFQASFLLTRLSAWENVALPLAYRGEPAATAKTQAEEMLIRVGMGDFFHHRPNQMSGGQQQRVAIARALVGRPVLILADEPTGALDEDTAEEVMELLLSLNAEERMTAAVITHDRAIARQCQRVVRLVDGVAVEQAPQALKPKSSDTT